MECRFVPNLGCDESDPRRLNGCRGCGWNPEVAQRRAERVRAKREQVRQVTAAASRLKS